MSSKHSIIFCELSPSTSKLIDDYVESLRRVAPGIGGHGMSDADFWASGLFRSAIERLRGQYAATMSDKQQFVSAALNYMEKKGVIRSWKYSGAGERHDYEIRINGTNDRVYIVETKGCLDGNNTNIFERPPQADEFIIWSLCQNMGADPRHNAWSGIHTRLSAEIIHRKQRVDGLVIWDMLCGTIGRPCPKLAMPGKESTAIEHYQVPPPCIYLFPRTIPDARSNCCPAVLSISDVKFLEALYSTFNCSSDDVVYVQIEARMAGSVTQRRTVYTRNGVTIAESKWTDIRRA